MHHIQTEMPRLTKEERIAKSKRIRHGGRKGKPATEGFARFLTEYKRIEAAHTRSLSAVDVNNNRREAERTSALHYIDHLFSGLDNRVQEERSELEYLVSLNSPAPSSPPISIQSSQEDSTTPIQSPKTVLIPGDIYNTVLQTANHPFASPSTFDRTIYSEENDNLDTSDIEE